MITIGQNFRLDDGYDSGALADGSVTSQNVGVFQDSQFARGVFLDLQHTPPLSEMAPILLVLDATSLKIVETLGRALVVGAKERHDTLVDLDTGEDVTLLQELNEGCSIVGLLVESLVEQDDTRDVLANNVLN